LEESKHILNIKRLPTNTILAMSQCQGKNEIMFCGTGLHFCTVKNKQAKPFIYLELDTDEIYLPNKTILRAVEMGYNKVIVCASYDEYVYIIDRNAKIVIKKISN